MSEVLKKREHLLGQLVQQVLSDATSSPANSGGATNTSTKRTPDAGRGLAFARKAISFHSYLDPHPDDVEEEWTSLGERLRSKGQYEKVVLLLELGRLLSKHCKNDGSVTQIDYHHRILLFLLRLSRDALAPLLDTEARERVSRLSDRGGKVQLGISDPAPPDWLHDDEDDEEALWWNQNITYSSDDQLSEWGDGDEFSEGNKPDPMGGSGKDTDSYTDTPREGENEANRNQETMISPNMSYLHMNGVRDSLQDAYAFVQSRIRPMWRDIGNIPGLSVERLGFRGRRYTYDSTSLTVWLSAKRCKRHLSEILNPRMCLSNKDFVSQALNCVLGTTNPGTGFEFLPSYGYKLKQGVHLRDVSIEVLHGMTEKVLTVAKALLEVDAIASKLTVVQHPGNSLQDSNSMIRAFGIGLKRQVKLLRAFFQSKMKCSDRGLLISLMQGASAVENAALALRSVCQIQLDDTKSPDKTAKEIIDMIQSVMDTLQLYGPTGCCLISFVMMAELLCSVLQSFCVAMDDWLLHGSLEHSPPEFCFVQNSDDMYSEPLNASNCEMLACPSLFEGMLRELHAVGLSSSMYDVQVSQMEPKKLNMTQSMMEMVKKFIVASISDLNVVPYKGHQDPTKKCHSSTQYSEVPVPTDSETDKENFPSVIEGTSRLWNHDWMETIQGGEDGVLAHLAPEMDLCMFNVSSAASEGEEQEEKFSRVVNISGHSIDERMRHSSELGRRQCVDSSITVSNWTGVFLADWHNTTDEPPSFIESLRYRILEKVEDISRSEGEREKIAPDLCEEEYPLIPTLGLRQITSELVASYGTLAGEAAMQRGILEQIQYLKNLVLLDTPALKRVTDAITLACSSHPGMDARAALHVNSLLSEALNDDSGAFNTRYCIPNVWIEAEPGFDLGAERDYTRRKLSYMKHLVWKVHLSTPIASMITRELQDILADLRDLILQMNWVWATLIAAKKSSMRNSTHHFSKETHTALFGTIGILRSIISATHGYIEWTFDTCLERVSQCSTLGEMSREVHRCLFGMAADGELSHNLPLRDMLRKWLDACLSFGILMTRAAQRKWNEVDVEHLLSPLSPSEGAFDRALVSSLAEVNRHTSNVLSSIKDAYQDDSLFSTMFKCIYASTYRSVPLST